MKCCPLMGLCNYWRICTLAVYVEIIASYETCRSQSEDNLFGVSARLCVCEYITCTHTI